MDVCGVNNKMHRAKGDTVLAIPLIRVGIPTPIHHKQGGALQL